MAVVYPGLQSRVAHMLEVKVAVRLARDEVKGVAEGLWAIHNRPGRHELTTQDDDVDALLSLDGPSPLSVEFGRHPDEHGKGAMRGLHILGRAAGL